jgi:hypothetical protein
MTPICRDATASGCRSLAATSVPHHATGAGAAAAGAGDAANAAQAARAKAIRRTIR